MVIDLTNEQILDITHSHCGFPWKRYNMFLIKLIIVEQLSEKEKLVLKLRFYNGMIYREISEIFGFSTSERPRQIIAKSLRLIRYFYPRYKKEYSLV